MPNWVFNGLTIEGNPEQVKNLIKQMNKPFIYSITPVGDLSYDVKAVSVTLCLAFIE